MVSIPSVSGPGTPTGVVAPQTPTGVSAFVVSGVNPETGKEVSANSIFIFATLDGTISGWNSAVGGISATGASSATLAATGPAGATFTGLAFAMNNGQPLLYAADDGQNRRVDVFDSNFQPVDLGPDTFVDPKIPPNTLRTAFKRSPPLTARKRFGSPTQPSIKLRTVLSPPSLPRAF